MTDTPVTDKAYPIRFAWVIRPLFIVIPFAIVLLIGNLIDTQDPNRAPVWVSFVWPAIVFAASLIGASLSRTFFHFSFDQDFLTVEQGFISRTQRNLPYHVIQNVTVHRDILDRLLGISTVTVENAAGAGGRRNPKYGQGRQYNLIGVSGNRVIIPGQKPEAAEALKAIVLEKMKSHPAPDTQSGL